MSLGLRGVSNSVDNRNLIDESYLNYFLEESGTVSLPSQTYTHLGLDISLSKVYRKPPLIMIRPTSNNLWISFNGLLRTSTGLFNGFNVTWQRSTAMGLNYLVFSQSVQPSASLHGIRSFNNLGNLVYDSEKKVALVRESTLYNLSIDNSTPDHVFETEYVGNNVSHGTYSNPYFALGSNGQGYAHSDRYGLSRWYTLGFRRTSSNTLSLGYFHNSAADTGTIPVNQIFTYNASSVILTIFEPK